MKNGYDNVSFFYDRLSSLIFGDKLQFPQRYFIEAIPANARVLIVGGGSGWILEAICSHHSKGLAITYIDSSPKMVGRYLSDDIGKKRGATF